MSDTQELPNLQDLTPEEANRIIHSHRKVRYGTACWPCRQRKVKCDNRSPCENCTKREHPQLCSYKPNRSTTGSKSGSFGSDQIQIKKRPHSPDDPDQDRALSSEPRESIGAFESEPAEIARYVGQNSIPALLREQTSSHAPQEANVIRQDMRSLLGLDTSAPFPLMSSRHMDRLTQDISSELPSDREVMKLFRTYKEIPQPFWGFVVDIDDLESKLMIYLEDRAKNARASTKTPKPVSASWLATLFGVLAVGSQYHDSPYHIRTRDSHKYIQISFHFLRLANFLLRPNLDSIQALLMTSFVLLNDMKAEASWALLGLTCRLAQSLGLHRVQALDSRQSAELMKKETSRRKLWWTCLWHDTLTSLSFDRSSMTNIPCCPIPLSPTADTEGWAYLEAMYHLCKIISDRLNPDAIASATYMEILDNCEAVESIRDRLLAQLRVKEACKSALDRLQHFAIRLHTSFIVSVCCRPALTTVESVRLDSSQKKFLADRCKVNLTETVRMFLAMHQLSVIPTRSWAFTYHGLSSAVLLGILGETKADPEVRQLQGDLISALSATAAKEQTSPQPHIQKSDHDIELSGPLSRALTALKIIYDHGSVTAPGVKGEGSISVPGSGTRTPLQPNQPSGLSSGSVLGLDPHQSAALAMAEMQQQQNGSVTPDFSHGIPAFGHPLLQQQGGLPDMSSFDPSTYMAPMDLYDSIFWESPDPFNTGVDSMNFDFLAQPPPGQPPPQQFYF
ncbi:fungal-specific transcription factor domain-containing protein [Lasiosphaeria miniovina]|uniref:Fungal-specific transcription factor domain-containing protein n=1 Tax=Lasiosphaeria miniovina TaxID=1954250 RepID=A0AA40DXQ3_9PEZI|nr:fungal-specific transcription factor domain-containing protein [Lasiosphaeria miniovina]KAK0717502.1 fungal-specific transcription factor domain-containing protein [Lasiosphaeria miniovina]